MRRFELIRKEDYSGVSGTGRVAEGIQFSDGRCAMRWKSNLASTALYESIEDLIAIHGHEGRTTVKFIDVEKHACVACKRFLPEGAGENEVLFVCDPYNCEIKQNHEEAWRCGRCCDDSSREI